MRRRRRRGLRQRRCALGRTRRGFGKGGRRRGRSGCRNWAIRFPFVHLALENALTRPDALETLGTPVDLGAIDVDSYLVAGSSDHIIPWENAYRSTQLLGGD